MKKLSFLTVVAGTMMLASCSHDNEVVTTVDDNAVQQIVLQVASNGDGLTTRAGRPLLSDEAGQKIDVVDIYIVNKAPKTGEKKLSYSKTISWSDATVYGGYTGKMKTLILTADEKLLAGNYTIYALGHTATEASDYDIPTFTEDNIASIVDYPLTFKSNKNTPEEIFAGSGDFTVDANRNFTQRVVLNRQVAGAYFYVYNLPMFKDLNEDCELQLVASDRNDQLVLGNFANTDIEGNGTGNDAYVKYVVNGKKSTPASTERVICKARIGDWYKKIVDYNNDGLVDITYTEVVETEGDDEEATQTETKTVQNWIKTKDASGRQGKRYVQGSIFASNFIIPFKSVEGTQTLKLVLVNGDDEIRTWNVNLQSNDDAPTSLSHYGSTNWPAAETVSENRHNYSIVRNHLYSVGYRNTDGVKNPDDPNDPDPDPDPENPDDPTPDPENPTDPNKPEDLSKGQSLTIRVNHNWEVIYKMELE